MRVFWRDSNGAWEKSQKSRLEAGATRGNDKGKMPERKGERVWLNLMARTDCPGSASAGAACCAPTKKLVGAVQPGTALTERRDENRNGCLPERVRPLYSRRQVGWLRNWDSAFPSEIAYLQLQFRQPQLGLCE